VRLPLPSPKSPLGLNKEGACNVGFVIDKRGGAGMQMPDFS
jgi:hypothetical protein